MSSKPSALLIGDSICMGYRPLVRQRLSEKVDILGIEDNGEDSAQILKNLDEWMINRGADLIHFNCGLHDLRVDPRRNVYQQTIDDYEANLKKIVSRIQKETTAKLVWATITPVIDERHNSVKEFYRYQRDVDAYNNAATAVMTKAGIVINDLYSAIKSDNIESCISPDGVHITEHGNKILTDAVCGLILRELKA